LGRRAILSPTNANAAKLNEIILGMIPEISSFRFSIDFPITERENNPLVIPEEFLNTLDPPGMPPHKLHLKLGAIYMLLRNMNVKDGLCNGTRFFLDAFNTNVLFCSMIQDDPNKPVKKFTLPRITLSPPSHYPFPFKRHQFPIKPAFVMTINKAQGGTLDVIGLEVTTPVFGHGQAYVALSRVSDFNKITVLTPDGLSLTRNVVFQEVFDQEYINTQTRLRSQRPIFGERMNTDYHSRLDDNSNSFYNDEEEAFMDHLHQPESYPAEQSDQHDDHHYPDAFQYTYDEMVFEDDHIPNDQ
jgi:ATP-dependent DNA helicase PIF1